MAAAAEDDRAADPYNDDCWSDDSIEERQGRRWQPFVYLDLPEQCLTLILSNLSPIECAAAGLGCRDLRAAEQVREAWHAHTLLTAAVLKPEPPPPPLALTCAAELV